MSSLDSSIVSSLHNLRQQSQTNSNVKAFDPSITKSFKESTWVMLLKMYEESPNYVSTKDLEMVSGKVTSTILKNCEKLSRDGVIQIRLKPGTEARGSTAPKEFTITAEALPHIHKILEEGGVLKSRSLSKEQLKDQKDQSHDQEEQLLNLWNTEDNGDCTPKKTSDDEEVENISDSEKDDNSQSNDNKKDCHIETNGNSKYCCDEACVDDSDFKIDESEIARLITVGEVLAMLDETSNNLVNAVTKTFVDILNEKLAEQSNRIAELEQKLHQSQSNQLHQEHTEELLLRARYLVRQNVNLQNLFQANQNPHSKSSDV